MKGIENLNAESNMTDKDIRTAFDLARVDLNSVKVATKSLVEDIKMLKTGCICLSVAIVVVAVVLITHIAMWNRKVY